MTTVVIQPSVGNAEARRHWDDTVRQPVKLQPLESLFTDVERAAFASMHRDGNARFWGTTSNHDQRMDTLRTGDVVLFTGQKHVQGIGEVGVTTRNARLANALWEPHRERGSFHNVYSLRSFEPTQIPYEEIWDLPSFNTGDNFIGARFLTGDRASEILDGLGIVTATAAEASEREARVQRQHSAAALQFLDDEAVNVEHTHYDRAAGRITVNRFEAMLVRRYRDHLGTETRRIRTPAGVTDMAVGDDDNLEVIEAKSSSSRASIRSAIGQLLDYCTHIPAAQSMTMLLPARPEPSLQALCFNVGIAVVYPDDRGAFIRHDPTPNSRNALRSLIHTQHDVDA